LLSGVKLSDWYRISRREVEAAGGGTLFCYYQSISEALSRIYPEFSWEVDRFVEDGTTPKGFWKENQNLMKALDVATARLGIKQVQFSFI